MFDRQRQVMTTMSETVLVVCLVRQQLLQYMVAIIQYATEEVVIAIGGKFCRRWVVGQVKTKPHSSLNKSFNAFFYLYNLFIQRLDDIINASQLHVTKVYSKVYSYSKLNTLSLKIGLNIFIKSLWEWESFLFCQKIDMRIFYHELEKTNERLSVKVANNRFD